MRVLITGGAGFLGARLARVILDRHPDAAVVLTDVVSSPRVSQLGAAVTFVQADVADSAACDTLVTSETTAVYHLASLVSGGAELDFEAGMRANVHATINLLEACRRRAKRPIFVFTSSIATFGGARLPSAVDDYTHQHPQNSYGVAKVVGEQLINDYTRKGYLDGRGVRLPAIVVRDVANTAASGYASTVIRELAAGRDYVCPVPPETRIPLMSTRTAVECLYALGTIDGTALGSHRTVNGEGTSPSVAEMEAALARIAPRETRLGKIVYKPDPAVEAIIAAWPRVMRADRSREIGLPGDESIDAAIADYLAESRMP